MAAKKLWEFATPNDNYLCTPITQHNVTVENYKIKHKILIGQQRQFGSSSYKAARYALKYFHCCMRSDAHKEC
jgi:hypothetical protein